MYKIIYRNMRLVSLLTMLLSIILFVSSLYVFFSGRVKSEIKEETNLIVMSAKQSGNTLEYLKSISNSLGTKRVTLIADDGTVLFDNDADIETAENHAERPEVIAAKERGTGEASRTSVTVGSGQYYYAVRMNDGSILRCAGVTHDVYRALLSIAIPIIIILFLFYLLTVVMSTNMTSKIVNNINKIDLSGDNVRCDYEELWPFVNKINAQKSEIDEHMREVSMQKVRLETIGKTMSEGLVVTDEKGNIISVNSSALKIFSVTEDDVMYKGFLHLSRDLVLESKMNETLDGVRSDATFSKDGTTYQVFFNPTLRDGKVVGVIMLVFDISEKAYSEQIRREFSANVSHELKTPLTSILGYSQMIGNGMAKPDDVQEFAQKIEKETERLIALINDIIKLSGLDEENSQPKYEKEDVRLLTVADAVREMLSAKADENKIKISIQGDSSVAHCNKSQVTEMLYNIVDNAIKYNVPNGSVDIIVANKSIAVADTGIGIPDEYKERIFERFFRVDKSHSKKIGGTGLGLSIVKHIAKLNDATIDIDDNLGRGTKMTIKFK